jgi:hypothetical protein
MAYIFVDDGFPEAAEYDNNYIWFDETDPRARADALEEARRRAVAVSAHADPRAER